MILLIGGSGRLGRALAAALDARGVPYRAPRREEFDLGTPGVLGRRLEADPPTEVINAAAFTNVSACESPSSRDEAFVVNRDAPEALARACARLEIDFVHVSTDYVFDGEARTPYRESDPTGPIQTYGRTKLEGEERVLLSWPRSLVVRVSTVYGPWVPERPAYPDAILAQALDLTRIEVVETPVASPTFTLDAAEAILDLRAVGASGIVHVVNDGGCSRLEFARAAVAAAGLAPRVEVVPREPGADPAARPAYSVLDTSLLDSLIGRRLRPWREALDAYVRMIGARGPA